jgi:Mce-associated membrane protein
MPRGKAARRAASDAGASDGVASDAGASDAVTAEDRPTEPTEASDPGEPTDTEPDTDADADAVYAERWAPGRFAVAAVGLAVALFIGAASFAAAMMYPVLADRATAETKLEIARTASGAITTLWTYTPENMDQLADRSAKYLGGEFLPQYRKYIDAIVPTNRQAQVSNSTEVVGAAVESLNGDDATAIVYTNSTSTSPLSKNIPSLRYLSWRLTLHRDGTRWLVTAMAPITSLDLTPKI